MSTGLSIFLVVLGASILEPVGKRFVTAPIRRLVKRLFPEGRLKRLLLTPLGYTKRAKEEAEFEATIEDYCLLMKRQDRRGARKGLTAPTDL